MLIGLAFSLHNLPPPVTSFVPPPTSVSPLPYFPPLPADGFLGLLGGMKRGAIGLVVLPLASLLEMCASTADSIRRAVAGSSNVGWVRPPRWVGRAGWVARRAGLGAAPDASI